MARAADGLDLVLSDGFSRALTVDVLHGTDVYEGNVDVVSWSLPGDLDRDPQTTGRLRIVHLSRRGESWVPKGASGPLSPFRATLLLTETIRAGAFERRVQLGMFDVVDVPFAQDHTATIGARWVEETVAEGDDFPDEFPDDDEFPGELVYAGGRLVGGRTIVVASVVDVEVESLDGRALHASLRSPRTAEASAWAEWRALGLLPVISSAPDVTVPPTTWPAERGSRTDAVRTVAQLLGGTPVVDWAGQWVLADEASPTVTLRLGSTGTVVDLASSVSLDGFANVIIGDYETEKGQPLRSVWVAPGRLSPDVMGREFVAFHTSKQVRTQDAADAAAAAEGLRLTTREVDVEVTCAYNPLLELGDHGRVVDDTGTVLVDGVVRALEMSDAETMQVVIRERRSL